MFKISWTLCKVSALHIHYKHGRTKSKPATQKEYNFRNQIHFGFGFFPWYYDFIEKYGMVQVKDML